VNASPSLTANTKEDYALKTDLLNDVFDVVDVEGKLKGDEEVTTTTTTTTAKQQQQQQRWQQSMEKRY
jgi:hypothetical protein